MTNLYHERFQAVMGTEEHRGFSTAFREGLVEQDVKGHAEDLQWCSGLVLCYPTWWYSFPAILKVNIVLNVSYGNRSRAGAVWHNSSEMLDEFALKSKISFQVEAVHSSMICAPRVKRRKHGLYAAYET